MKILNLYAGIGGNRKLWGNNHEITAVERDPEIASVYADLFPADVVVVADAHNYLLKNHAHYDFIWSSPPCQTHSSLRYNLAVKLRGADEKYPDMKLYEEIMFMRYHSESLWLVENVVPYYPPMLDPVKRNRHLYWANFDIPELPRVVENIRSTNKISDMEELHGFDLSAYRLQNKRQILRNCVAPETGLRLLRVAENEYNRRATHG